MRTYHFSLLIGLILQPFLFSSVWSYEAIEVKDGGMVSGTVKLVGYAPPPAKLAVTKDLEVCGKSEKFDEALVVGTNQGIKNVVVSITNIHKGKPQEAKGILDQKECVYTPRVVLSPAGAELSILNSDGILHNFRTYSTKNPPMNKAQPKFRKKLTETFAYPETIKVTCDAHGWMLGWLIVTEHPYYSVTDADGAFTLTDIPPGDYDLTFWHETLGVVTRSVSVLANGEVTLSVEMAKKMASAYEVSPFSTSNP